MLTIREKFISVVDNDLLSPSNAIILLEGDGLFRYPHAVHLYKEGWAPLIVFSGGITDYQYGSYPFSDVYPKIIESGVASEDVIHESTSQHTKEQADRIIEMALFNKWESLILVASGEHQYRAYLTFLKKILDEKLQILLFNAPSIGLPWFQPCEWGIRYERLDQEFLKIDKYTESGHLASFEEAIEYQQWKEKRVLK